MWALTMCCSEFFMGTVFNLPSNSVKKVCLPPLLTKEGTEGGQGKY